MNLREVITQFVPPGFRDEDGVWHEGPHRANAELELAALTNGLERAAYLVDHLVQQVPEFTGVIGPAGEREDDAIRDQLVEEAREWRVLAEAAQQESPTSLIPVRALTMQDRLLVTAHIQTLANDDPPLQVIADTVIDCVRCCGEFPECTHVLAESERVDEEEGRIRSEPENSHANDGDAS